MAFNDDIRDDVMSDINMTPLIDVMLVLLIVFMVTLPVMTNSVNLDLPSATSNPTDEQNSHVTVAVQRDGSVHWDDAAVDATQLEARLTAAAVQNPQPELQMYADKDARYEVVANVLASAQRAGLTKIDFVTEPTTP
ncbi:MULTISPECIES: ExbD/TolR family protein [Paraburkholderia]|uniref:ExbD/TolR family protein n=1 Tax=Paraburkholderia TaxID=1822464 RepID=UPI002AB010EF|nr:MULTISPECIES: biopolymer transporter ExbD [Paraburkholderia]